MELRWESLTGHREQIKELAVQLQEGRLPHALLFSEQSGCGALTLVLALIQFIFCKTRRALESGEDTWELKGLFGDNESAIPKDDACQVCSSCIKVRNLQHQRPE